MQVLGWGVRLGGGGWGRWGGWALFGGFCGRLGFLLGLFLLFWVSFVFVFVEYVAIIVLFLGLIVGRHLYIKHSKISNQQFPNPLTFAFGQRIHPINPKIIEHNT